MLADLIPQPLHAVFAVEHGPEVVLPDRAESLRHGGLGVLEHRPVQGADQVVAVLEVGQVGGA